MKKTGIFYSFNTKNTSAIADQIYKALQDSSVEMVNMEDITWERFAAFDNYICGVPTWFDGELPNYWDEFVPSIEEMDLSGKRIAIFGLGDQVGYPENFADAVGIMAQIFGNSGATLVGRTTIDGYTFESSLAQEGDEFLGLILDIENQAELNTPRIDTWVRQLKQELA